eukprot:8769404-Pyramimonas_sp.AAC.1
MQTALLGVSMELPTGPQSVLEVSAMSLGAHAGPATGTFEGAPSGATKCVAVVPTWARERIRAPPNLSEEGQGKLCT